MNKKDIMLLFARKGFNENQTWLTFIPYNYKLLYSKSDKFNGLRLFDIFKSKDNSFRVDIPIYQELTEDDFLQKATLEYELVDIGSLHPILKPTKLVINQKVFDLYKGKETK